MVTLKALLNSVSKRALIFSFILVPCGTQPISAQERCRSGMSNLTIAVEDSTSALVPGASILIDHSLTGISRDDGHADFGCLKDGLHSLQVSAVGFTLKVITITTPHSQDLHIALDIQSVQTTVDVSASESDASNASSTGGATTFTGQQLDSLADDPDDLKNELNNLGAISGGSPSSTIISVDGFKGASALPPKSAIAYIKINPDQFSAEYRELPYEGGHVEIYTKPGQLHYHGALFGTDSSSWENARDPFALAETPIGKQRVGAQLSGPIRKVGSNFSLTLEHRSLESVAAVNAVTLNAQHQIASTLSTVPQPEHLWTGQARADWQTGSKNTIIGTYDATVNSVQNAGAGGTTLAESGYDSQSYEHTMRLTDVTLASSKVMHESKLSLRWDGELDRPSSTTPQLAVEGAFTGGGASIGARRLAELNIEADDDMIVSFPQHTMKFGAQLSAFIEHQRLLTNFNGTYVFGGGSAPALTASDQVVPGQTIFISGLEQYRRTVLELPGGTPTAFSQVQGVPQVDFTQQQNAFFLVDDWSPTATLKVSSGFRYQFETNPAMLNGFSPRIGLAWSPTVKSTWSLHAHAGIFSSGIAPATSAEVLRMDGTSRKSLLGYNPSFTPSGQGAFVGSTPVASIRSFSSGLGLSSGLVENVGGMKTVTGGWTIFGDVYMERSWNDTRTLNVNAPFTDDPLGRRPGLQNLNIFSITNSARSHGNSETLGIDQHRLKHVLLFAGVVRVDRVSDTEGDLFSPQDSRSDVGEAARSDTQALWQYFVSGHLRLPAGVDFGFQSHGYGGERYNVITGMDENGDGIFNDRPQTAVLDTPGAVPTPFGLLVASGGISPLPRNIGVMPWQYLTDVNVERKFALLHKLGPDEHSMTVNIRSSNVLNHTNVTNVGNVFNSPLFGKAYAAGPGRRVEFGFRYAF